MNEYSKFSGICCAHVKLVIVTGEVDHVMEAVWWLTHVWIAGVPQSVVNHSIQGVRRVYKLLAGGHLSGLRSAKEPSLLSTNEPNPSRKFGVIPSILSADETHKYTA